MVAQFEKQSVILAHAYLPVFCILGSLEVEGRIIRLQ